MNPGMSCRRKADLPNDGSQGEPLSVLHRVALDDHKSIKVDPGDTVILSSKFIPGNEKTISNLINHLYRRGAEVHYEKVSEIHVSGHASQEELKTMLQLTRPLLRTHPRGVPSSCEAPETRPRCRSPARPLFRFGRW